MPTPLKRVGACQNWSTYVFGPFPVHCEILVELYVANSVSEFDELTQCATKRAHGKGFKISTKLFIVDECNCGYLFHNSVYTSNMRSIHFPS